jgi:hypothetical protein
MALIVQTYPTVTAGANGYVSLVELKAYLDARLKSYAGKEDPQLEAAIIEATTYVDLRFTYIGYRLEANQDTEWPRQNAWDDRGDKVDGIPKAVKSATCEYAFRALSAELMADPERDASGLQVQSKSETVGPISTAVTFADRAGSALPAYPAADRLLTSRGLVFSGTSSGLGTMNTVLG